MKKIETKVLFRCHGLGQIMTNPQGKSNLEKFVEAKENLAKYQKEYQAIVNKETKTAQNKLIQIEKTKQVVKGLELVKDEVILSTTCRKFLKTMAIEIRYKRRKRMNNKYIKKGKYGEPIAVDEFSEYKGQELIKNTGRIENEYLTGETDIDYLDEWGTVEKVTDIKCSYDLDSFEDNRDEEAKKDNFYQGQGYCALKNCDKFSVANVLVNNDFEAINGELRKEIFTFPINELNGFDLPLWKIIQVAKEHIYTLDGLIEFLTNQTVQHCENEDLVKLSEGVHECEKAQKEWFDFVEIDLEDRVIEIEIERNQPVIDAIYSRIEHCRKYLETKYNIYHVTDN